MAMAATSRRGEHISHSKSQPELDPPHSPSPNRETTPRPSISPLSARPSPKIVRETTMPNLSATEKVGAMIADVGDDQDDRSSSLSEPEDIDDEDDNDNDDEDDEEEDEGEEEDAEEDEEDEDEEQLPRSVRAQHAPGDVSAQQQQLDVDSEAETERLEQTPQKMRRQAELVNKTPSKLSQAATAEDDLSDPPSPLPATGPGAASSTSTVETAGKLSPTAHEQITLAPTNSANNQVAGKKRKRSDTADSSLTSAVSDLDESPRKRTHSFALDETTVDDEAPGLEPDDDAPDHAEISVAAEYPEADVPDTMLISQTKGGRGRKGHRLKGRTKGEILKEADMENSEATELPEEQPNNEAAVGTKSAEDSRHKQAASTMYEDLAKHFTAFREKMHMEKLAAVDAELEMLTQADCKHPEFLRQVACVDARRQKQVREIQAFRRYKVESLRRTTLGERSQLHSQYFQYARELREGVMYKLGEDWYNIQKERRQSHQDKDDAYVYKFPTKRSDQIKQQAKYNQEVSVLSGFAKYVGFPAAPDISGAPSDSIESDLKAMKITKRAHQPISQHPQPYPLQNRAELMEGPRERLAHHQFMEQNAWARPQGPIPHHGTPNVSHTPDWATEPGSHGSKLLLGNVGGGIVGTANSPYATPMGQRRAPIVDQHPNTGAIGVHSDPIDPPSSVSGAPPTSDRLQHAQFGREHTSPLVVSKQRQHGAELTGFRNISNVSGASTIDATPDSAEKERHTREALVFDSSQTPRNGIDSKRQPELYTHETFRAKEGAFGTPTPIPASHTAP